VKIREYSGPLTVLAAGVLGFSLICIVSAAALTNPGTSESSDIGAQDIVDSAFSNPISTAVALTAIEISEYIPTTTPTFTESVTPSPTDLNYITPTRPFVTWTPVPPTRTRMGRLTATSVPSRIPSRTPTNTQAPLPTNTRVPTLTYTPLPPPTETPVPPTETQSPTDTAFPTDQPTDTPVAAESPLPQGQPLPTAQP
jgi:hypothetical protein